MSQPTKAATRPSVVLNFQLLRNTTSPDETNTGVKSFCLNLPAFEILKVGTQENLRTYIAEHNSKKRNRVHDAIAGTIEKTPERFITRNSGFVIAASDVEVDDSKREIRLYEASVINGAQSQGEIRRWVTQTFGDETPALDTPPFYVRVEVIVDPDAQQIVETAIARNTATPVKSISQAGARKHLDDLELSVQAVLPGVRIRKSETDEGDDFFDTRKILQYARLLMPASLSGNDNPSEKLRPYKNPEQCLSDFSEWWENWETDESSRRKYDFTVQIAPLAMQEYQYWETHGGWDGHRLWEETKKGGRACRRGKGGKVCWVSPGLVFPIVGAMSEFVEEYKPNQWRIAKPRLFKPSELIAGAVKQFRGVDSDPMQMGRDPGVYDALRTYPKTLMDIMRDMAKSQA